MIRVLLVDDQTLVRQGIRSLLELSEEIEIAGEAQDGRDALAQIASLRPDVILLDLRMPVLDGIGTLRALSDETDPPPTLVLTTFDDDALVLEAMQAGAKGFLLKDVSLEQLLEAIRSLDRGGTYVQPAVTARILEGLPRLGEVPDGFEVLEALTERELEVLRLMAGGYSNKEIARGLDMSEGTAKNHVSSILSKLGVRDRTRAVLKALEARIL